MCRTESDIISQMPHTSTCMTFLPITSRLAAVVGSEVWKCRLISERIVLAMYLNRNHRLTTIESLRMLTLRFSRLMKSWRNICQQMSPRLKTSAAQ